VQKDSIVRWRLQVRGIVQGVGFRPCVYRLATELKIGGWVWNAAAGVEIEVEGPERTLVSFLQRLRTEAPPLAFIHDIETETRLPRGEKEFVILPSRSGAETTLLPPDLATCERCLAEVCDPTNRRFRYAFANCTDCGPRFTIVEALPYERAATTMSDFPLCPACVAEYYDPTDRRFHAEPVACPVCGPHVQLVQHDGGTPDGSSQDDIVRAAMLLAEGAVIAVQGVGGFHLVCDATNEAAVRRLRLAKDRAHKPLAVMTATLSEACLHGEISEEEARLLTSVHAPIVLVRQRSDSWLAAAVAPGQTYVGLMLPYSPLHVLLVQDAGRPLVMTSGNRRDEPLCRTHAEAEAALGQWVDALLVHNRPIKQRCDDSVFFVADTGPQPVRRSRGYTPLPVCVPLAAPRPLLAVGAELKNTFCLLHDREAFLSQHLGDMSSLATQRHWSEALAHLQALLKTTPEVIAHDLHPDYATSRYAVAAGVPIIGVQHHHAHIVSCLADNGETGPVIGVAFDGAGYGLDGAIWGGEFLVTDIKNFRRVGHLQYLPLPGGDAAIRRPSRIALAYLMALLPTMPALPFLERLSQEEQRVIARMLDRRINTPLTSSCGRLFDAVAAMIGVQGEVTYEAQAAIELETLSTHADVDQPIYPFVFEGDEVKLGSVFQEIVHDLERKVAPGVIGRRFHATVAEIVGTVCSRVRKNEGLDKVALSGGCFQNRLLLGLTARRLRQSGFTVYTHRQVPTNDGGISLGQALVAAARLTELA